MGLHAGVRKRFKATVVKLRKRFPRSALRLPIEHNERPLYALTTRLCSMSRSEQSLSSILPPRAAARTPSSYPIRSSPTSR